MRKATLLATSWTPTPLHTQLIDAVVVFATNWPSRDTSEIAVSRIEITTERKPELFRWYNGVPKTATETRPVLSLSMRGSSIELPLACISRIDSANTQFHMAGDPFLVTLTDGSKLQGNTTWRNAGEEWFISGYADGQPFKQSLRNLVALRATTAPTAPAEGASPLFPNSETAELAISNTNTYLLTGLTCLYDERNINGLLVGDEASQTCKLDIGGSEQDMPLSDVLAVEIGERMVVKTRMGETLSATPAQGLNSIAGLCKVAGHIVRMRFGFNGRDTRLWFSSLSVATNLGEVANASEEQRGQTARGNEASLANATITSVYNDSHALNVCATHTVNRVTCMTWYTTHYMQPVLYQGAAQSSQEVSSFLPIATGVVTYYIPFLIMNRVDSAGGQLHGVKYGDPFTVTLNDGTRIEGRTNAEAGGGTVWLCGETMGRPFRLWLSKTASIVISESAKQDSPTATSRGLVVQVFPPNSSNSISVAGVTCISDNLNVNNVRKGVSRRDTFGIISSDVAQPREVPLRAIEHIDVLDGDTVQLRTTDGNVIVGSCNPKQLALFGKASVGVHAIDARILLNQKGTRVVFNSTSAF